MIWPFARKPAVEQKSSLANPETWLLELFGATPAASGKSVTPATAMRCTAVRRAVQAISEPIGQLPLHVYKRDGEARERDSEHPVARVLKDPNPWTSASDFREQLQRDCLLHGNGYAFINRVDGNPKELLRFDPSAVKVKVDKVSGEPSYEVTEGGAKRTYPSADIFHLKAPSLNGYVGESIVTQCREAIGIALTIEEHVARLFGSGARPSGILEFPNKLGAEAVEKIKAAWQASHGGSENAAKTPVLWEGGKFNPLTFSSVDSQTLELRRYSVDEISRAFGVPPHLLFEMGRATWGNSSELGSSFVTFTLMRWIKAWQGEIRLKLFSPEERDDWFAEFLLEDLLKADLSARATAYSQLRTAGIMSINECRARENLASIGPEGDRHDNPNVAPANDNTPPKEAAA